MRQLLKILDIIKIHYLIVLTVDRLVQVTFLAIDNKDPP